MKRSIFFYDIPREKTEEAFKAAASFVKWYESPDKWEKERIKFADFTVSESKNGNVIVRYFGK